VRVRVRLFSAVFAVWEGFLLVEMADALLKNNYVATSFGSVCISSRYHPARESSVEVYLLWAKQLLRIHRFIWSAVIWSSSTMASKETPDAKELSKVLKFGQYLNVSG
jgi:hypothetical protein